MAALDLIREGISGWASGMFNIGFPVLALVMFFFAGISFAAVASRMRKQQPDEIEEIRPPAPVPEQISDRDIMENAPFPIWSNIGDGINFTNAQYHNIAGLDYNPEGIFAYSDSESSDRHMVNVEGKQRWFTTSEVTFDGEKFTFALPADDLVKAENSLRRLMETLSTTFAHLPVGLVIFDADKTLAQFNPAISALLGLDPTWLAMRPSMSTFLEMLRENRHLPEQKNFLEWRRLLTEMNATTPNKHYSDQWNLPNGATLQVTGQAHAQGAITFLFEDITAQITLERQHLAETALNQAVLDRVSDAIVVINPAGSIAFANASFDRLFGMKSMGSLSTPDISTLATMWPETADFWSKLQAFISQAHNRAPWVATLDLLIEKSVDVFPMPDGSTLVSFADSGTITESQQIKSIFQVADAMFTNSSESTSMNDPLNLTGLTNFLDQREIAFDLSGFMSSDHATLDPTKTRRILWYLVLAASNICRDGGTISLAATTQDRSVKISCVVNDDDILSGQNNHLSLSLLRQLVGQTGGGAEWVFDDNAHPLTVSCILAIKDSSTVTQFLTGSA